MPKKIDVKGPIVSNDVGWIYDLFGWDCATTSKLQQALTDAAGEDIIVEVNSPGGVCVYGYEMYKALMDYEGKVTSHIISAMSAATLIACASDETLISDAGIFMIHNAKTLAAGDYKELGNAADALKEFNNGIINAYVRKTGKSRDELQNLMDNETYMSPQRAIENGFVDGYIYGNPEEKEDASMIAATMVASEIPVITEDKIKALKEAFVEELMQAQETDLTTVQPQNIGNEAVSDKTKEGGKEKMTLAEFLNENPDAQSEINDMVEGARVAERERIKSLDAISATVSADALNDAKYESLLDGPALAYKAMLDGEKMATAYMGASVEDSAESGVEDVAVGTPDVGEEVTDEAEELAAHVNRGR